VETSQDGDGNLFFLNSPHLASIHMLPCKLTTYHNIKCIFYLHMCSSIAFPIVVMCDLFPHFFFSPQDYISTQVN